MGIRIHKMIGYGLTDLVEDDPRINWDSPLLQFDLHGGEEDMRKYVEFLDARAAVLKEKGDLEHYGWSSESSWVKNKFMDAPRQFDLSRAFTWGTSDYGMENVFCVRQYSYDDWYRYDDTIDYLECEPYQDSVRKLPYGLFPYSDSYMDTRTGERAPRELNEWMRVWNNVKDKDKETFFTGNYKLLNKLAGLAGMTHKDAEEFIVPMVPSTIRAQCEFAESFTDENTWMQMRPMIYTYWG